MVSYYRRDMSAGGQEFVQQIGFVQFDEAGGSAVRAAEVSVFEDLPVNDYVHIFCRFQTGAQDRSGAMLSPGYLHKLFT